MFGGLGLFLYGIHIMGEGLQKAAGKRLRRILEVLTNSPLKGILVGLGVTAIIQSSSATTVMLVGFVDAGLLTLRQAVGVILGANIGTTVTAQVVALDLGALALPAIGLGFVLFFFSRGAQWRDLGQVVLGFGLLFLGMETMSTYLYPLRDNSFFLGLMTSMSYKPFLAVLVGMVVTGIIQSSSATTGMVIALAGAGLLDLPAAVGLVLGSNIGTTATAMLASVGTSLNARRAALVHFLFNVTGVLLFLPFLDQFQNLIRLTSVSLNHQVANAHTLFNVINTIIFIPFLEHLERLVKHLLPGEELVLERGLKYIDNREVTRLPGNIALGQVTKEIVRMGELAKDSLEDAVACLFQEDCRRAELVEQKEEVIDELEMEITSFLATLSQQGLGPDASRRLTGLLHAVNDLERVGDHACELARLVTTKLDRSRVFSPEAVADLKVLYKLTTDCLAGCIEALRNHDLELARKVVAWEKDADEMQQAYRDKHIKRLNEGICMPGAGVIYLDVISNLGRVIDHANNVAHMVLDDF